jgi:glutathione peroxidase-family protein
MKALQFIIGCVAVLAMAACSDEFEDERNGSDITVTAELPQTRTAFTEDGDVTHVTWKAKDAIGLFTNKQQNLEYVASSNGSTINLNSVGDKLNAQEGDTVFAYYPYNKDASSGTIPVSTTNLNASSSITNYDYMYAKGVVKDGKVYLRFQHLFAILKVTVKPYKFVPVGVMGIMAAGNHLSVSSLSIKDHTLVPGETSSYLYYKFDEQSVLYQNKDRSFYIPILPQAEDVTLRFYSYKPNSTLYNCLFFKHTPTGGLLAGNVYRVTADKEIEACASIAQSQQSALYDLYEATDGKNWTNNTNWCTNVALNEWGCMTWQSSLTSLNLQNNNLTGSLPESFAQLMDADHTYIYNNNLSGDIPQSVTSHTGWRKHWNEIIYGNQFNTAHVPAPTFSLRDIDGKSVTSDVYARNKLTVLLYWSAWDYASIIHMPDMLNLYSQYHDKGLEIIGFDNVDAVEYSLYDTMEEMRNFIKDNDIKWPNIPNARDGNTIHFLHSNLQAHVVDSNGEFVCTSSYADASMYVNNYFSGDYTSSDYSRDGEVFTIQKATEGKGIDLVFIGDGFVDRDMESGGWYEQRMKAAADDFFAYEPYKSLRNRFNVYGVKVVSDNEIWTEESIKKHRINGNNQTAFEYASKAVDGQARYVTVIYNVDWTLRRSYASCYSDGSFVALIMAPSVGVVQHEASGHGFGRLLDEYVEDGYEDTYPTQNEMDKFDKEWKEYEGRGANTDWRNDLSVIRWAHLINDPRYAGEELGAYEGAALLGKGMYRPTENSVMRNNYLGAMFNAPSREQIYKLIMKRSEGNDWTYDYETFVEFDAINRTSSDTRALKNSPSREDMEYMRSHHRAPVFINGTWRDAMKSNQQSYCGPLR